ncbi:MAG: glycosyltransferase family 4 protein, partial [Terriglobales bacterium]
DHGSVGSVTVLALHDHKDEQFRATTGLEWVEHSGFGGSKWGFSLASLRAARSAEVIVMAHVHFAPLAHLIRWVAPQASVCFAAHGIEVWKHLTPLTISALRHADQIWPVSDYTRRRMLAENPGLTSGPRFSILPNTLGPNYPGAGQTQGRGALGLPPGKILLCVSRMSTLEPYKNVEMIVRAMPEVLRAQPQTTLVVVGPGDDRPRLEAVVAELGVGKRVIFAGRVADEVLQSYFAACDLFVLPSTGEGFGIVYLEAMYHGKACIGAQAGGVPEVIEDGVTGGLIDPEVPAQLSATIVRLLQDDATRAAMGSAGKKRLEEKFSLDSFRARLKALLSGLS